MKISADTVMAAPPVRNAHGKKSLFLGRALLGISAAFAISAFWFSACNLHDGYAAGQASSQILHDWDGLSVSEIEDEDVMVEGDNAYIGIVTIPSLGIELPVNREWSTAAAKTSPCRYTGSVAGSDLILAAHNFATQFGGIHGLSEGDAVTFTDAHGIEYRYEVSGIEVLEGTDIAKMQEGDWDLTLFTCTIGGKQRVTVRCQYADIA